MGGSLDPQGPVAEAMAGLWWLMLALGIVVFFVFAVLLAIGLFRRPSSTGATEPPSIARWIVGGGVVLPLVVIVVVFAATVIAMRAIPTTPPQDALIIDIVGRQFSYDISYPDQGVESVDELHIPVGRPVALRLTSADVIHSFWVPQLAGKLDMLPDDVTTLVLQADEPGEHQSRCAEFCGLHHATMVLTVIAEPEERFADWMESQR